MPAAEKALFSVTDLDQANDKSPRGLSEREKKLRRSVNFRPVSLKEILNYIDIQDFDPELKQVLRKQVSRYPNQALQRFADNFEHMVNVAQRQLRKPYVVEPISKPLDAAGPRPTGQYLPPTIQPKAEPKPVFTAKKISIDEVDDFDSEPSSDLMETPVESLNGVEVPVSVTVAVKVNNVPQEIEPDQPLAEPMGMPREIKNAPASLLMSRLASMEFE